MRIIIATFLRDSEGDFDYAALLFSLFLAFCISGMVFGLYKAFRTGGILLAWSLYYGGSGRVYIERKKNPGGFWCACCLYCLAILLLGYLTVGVCFGLLRGNAVR
jgi:hypothetical protein